MFTASNRGTPLSDIPLTDQLLQAGHRPDQEDVKRGQHERNEEFKFTNSISVEQRTHNQQTDNPGVPSFRHSYDKLGVLAALAVGLGNIVVVTCLALLAFLWFGDRGNSTWRFVVIHDHLLTVVSGISKVLEFAVASAISSCAAMIAAILFENYETRLADAAEVSMARNYGGLVTLLLVLRKQMRHAAWRTPFLLAAASLSLYIFSAIITVLLNVDIGLTSLPDYSTQDIAAVSFNATNLAEGNSTWRLNPGTTWQRKLVYTPAFAQSSEIVQSANGVLDTGATLRSFLPYKLDTARRDIQDFQAIATVFDNRVACQAPILNDISLSSFSSQSSLIRLNTTFKPSKAVAGLINHTLLASGPVEMPTELQWDTLIWASCIVDSAAPSYNYDVRGYQKPWRSSICQLPNGWNPATNRYEYSGGLNSEFQQAMFDNSNWITQAAWESWKWGNAFLVLNITNGNSSDIATTSVDNDDGTQDGMLTTSERDEWTDVKHNNLVLSVSICYSSFMSADLPIHMSTTLPTPDTTFRFDPIFNRWVFPLFRQSLGQNPNTGATYPIKFPYYKLLSPQRQTWTATSTKELAPAEPYMRNAVNMWNYQFQTGADMATSIFRYNGSAIAIQNGSISALMLQSERGRIYSDNDLAVISPDPTISDLFQDAVTTGGGIAFALQSLFHSMVANEYYDRLFMFDVKDPNATKTYFISVNAPVQAKGIIVVITITVFYLILVFTVVAQFLRSCNYTMLGNSSWRIFSQTISATTSSIAADAPALNDRELELMLRQHGRANVLVRLNKSDPDQVPKVMEVNSTRKRWGRKQEYDRIVD